MTLKRLARGSAALLSCVALPTAACRPYLPENGSIAAEYAVYRAVLKHLNSQGQAAGPPFLVSDASIQLGSPSKVRGNLEYVRREVEKFSPISIQSDLIADLAEKAPRRFKAEAFKPQNVILVPHRERMLTRAYGAKYAQDVPVVFSRVGFNRTGTHGGRVCCARGCWLVLYLGQHRRRMAGSAIRACMASMRQPPNKALQRTRSAPLRSPLSFETLGRALNVRRIRPETPQGGDREHR